MSIKNESTYYNVALDFEVAAREDSSSVATAYLDLDGVIYPHEPAYRLSAGVDTRDIERQRKGNDLEWWHTKIVERIGRLPLEIVMCSSWGETFMSDTVKSPRAVLNPTRALSERAMRATSKLAVIAHDIIESPKTPFVIVEDGMDVEEAAEVFGRNIPYLLIKPDSMIGVTHKQIDQLEVFLADMQDRIVT
jgi:hypothetical protein